MHFQLKTRFLINFKLRKEMVSGKPQGIPLECRCQSIESAFKLVHHEHPSILVTPFAIMLPDYDNILLAAKHNIGQKSLVCFR